MQNTETAKKPLTLNKNRSILKMLGGQKRPSFSFAYKKAQ